MAAVIAFAGEDHHAVVKEDAFMEAPAAKAFKVVGTYNKGETVLRFFAPDGGPRLPQLRQTWFCQAEGCGRP